VSKAQISGSGFRWAKIIPHTQRKQKVYISFSPLPGQPGEVTEFPLPRRDRAFFLSSSRHTDVKLISQKASVYSDLPVDLIGVSYLHNKRRENFLAIPTTRKTNNILSLFLWTLEKAAWIERTKIVRQIHLYAATRGVKGRRLPGRDAKL
jgi:hypothetical protein